MILKLLKHLLGIRSPSNLPRINADDLLKYLQDAGIEIKEGITNDANETG